MAIDKLPTVGAIADTDSVPMKSGALGLDARVLMTTLLAWLQENVQAGSGISDATAAALLQKADADAVADGLQARPTTAAVNSAIQAAVSALLGDASDSVNTLGELAAAVASLNQSKADATATAAALNARIIFPNGGTPGQALVLLPNGAVGWATVTAGAPAPAPSPSPSPAPAPSPVAPTVQTSPSLAAALAGSAASYSQGTYSGTPTPLLSAVQWYLSTDGGSTWTVAPGTSTGATYTPASGNTGARLRVAETYANTAGQIVGTSNAVTIAAAPVTVPNGGVLVTALYPQDPDMQLVNGTDWASVSGTVAAVSTGAQAFHGGSSIGIMAGDGFVETTYADAQSSAYIVLKSVNGDHNSDLGRLAFLYLAENGSVNSGVNGNDNIFSNPLPVGGHVGLRRVGTTVTTERQDSGTGAWTVAYTFPAPVSGPIRVDLGTGYDGTKKMRSVAATGISALLPQASSPSSIAAVPGQAPIGINWASYSSGSRPNVFVDMVKQGGFIETPSTGAPITQFDSNGWPTVDFRIQAHLLDDSTAVQDCAAEIGGWADSISIDINSGRMSVLNKVYDSANNKTTFTVRFAAGNHDNDANLISFNGTRRTGGSTGAVNTGLSYFRMAHPGYSLSDIGAKKFTDEYLSWMRTFKAIRFMDALDTNNDTTSTAWSAPGPTPVGISLDDMIDLCNAVGCDMWVCFLLSYTDAAVASMAAYIDSRLNTGLHFNWEYSNETWNPGFRAFHIALDRAATEVRGFVGDTGSTRNITWSRASNVVTLTTSVAHGWSAGNPIYIPDTGALGGNGTSGTPTLLTASGNTATITSPGADTGPTQPSSGFRVSYDLTGTLASWDGRNDLYALKSRWCIRRAKQMSDAIRGVLGDAKMQTRCRAVWADQISGSDPSVFDYIAATFPARTVNQYFYGWAGAPYYGPNSTATDNNATKAAIVADLNASAASMKSGVSFDSRVIGAAKYGLRALWYEGGPDTTEIYHGEGNSDFSNAALVRNQAQLDPGMKTGVEAMLSDWFKADGDLAMWYSGLFIGPSDNNRFQCWAVTDTVSDFTAGKMAAFRELKNQGVPVNRNIVSTTVGQLTTIDGRLCENYYDAAAANPPATGNSRRFLIYAPTAGIYTVSATYSATGNSYSAYLAANLDPAQYFGGLVANSGPYPDYSSDTHETPAKQIYLHAGSNCLNLYAGENHGGGDVMWRSMKLTRVS